MKFYEEKTSTYRACIKVTCDICKEEIREGLYDVSEVEISCKLEERYPEGGSHVETSIDCCVTCFQSKVKLAVEALGCAFRETTLSY